MVRPQNGGCLDRAGYRLKYLHVAKTRLWEDIKQICIHFSSHFKMVFMIEFV